MEVQTHLRRVWHACTSTKGGWECVTCAYSHGSQLEIDGIDVHNCIIHAVHVVVAAHALGAL